MEEIAVLLIPAIAAAAALRLLVLPMRLIYKVVIHMISGFACLWVLNRVSCFTGIFFPINAVTVLAAGVLGLPGVGLLALLAVL